jgi:hypothetical protein
VAHIRLEIQGKPRTISVHAFQAAVDNWLVILRDLDVALSNESKGSLDWVITDLSIGSAVIEAESQSKSPDKNVGPEVVHACINGMRQLENGVTPAYLSPRGMESARRLVNTIGREGTAGFVISNTSESAELSARATVNVNELLKERYRSIGSIEGRMETLNLHRYARFIIYQSRTGKAVVCKFDVEKQLEEVKNLIGKRVNAYGAIYSNSIGEPLRVEVKQLRRLRERNELPPIELISGSVPKLTGGLRTAEHLAEVRGG